MDRAHYVFRSVWRLPAPVPDVYRVLVDVAAYPRWWPQVRSAVALDEDSGELVCRSVLPYRLRFVARREIEDETGAVLRARVEGDIRGWTQWQLCAIEEGCHAVFDEDVWVTRALLHVGGWMARPVLRGNHALMMRAGERGLLRELSGVRNS